MLSLLLAGCGASVPVNESLSPYPGNPFYWQHKGQPVLLIGGSVEDNLFQLPAVEQHLDLLQSVGGNYVRCTMSSRDEGNLWAFERDSSTGLYDLNRPNQDYWLRFEQFLNLTASRDIIVQIEVWATFDFYDGKDMSRPFWQANPFNPKNNINYTSELSGLPEVVDSHPTQTRNPFFWSVPEEGNNHVLLTFQQAFVDKLLTYTLPHSHVLYCMDNETSVTPEWGAYWARYIKNKADSSGVSVQTTEMWDPWDLSHDMHRNTFDHPETYSFVDISQNNHQKGQSHWNNSQLQRTRVARTERIRPLNNVKIYGADGGRFGDTRDGVERFWRNIIGGLASARFHRPDSGIGLSPTAQSSIRSARMLTSSFDIFQSQPSNHLLAERHDNEAYCTAVSGQSYAVFFPQGGKVLLDTSAAGNRPMTIEWLDISASRWIPTRTESASAEMVLEAPSEGYWAALVKPRKN
jgi:hypothetical protein